MAATDTAWNERGELEVLTFDVGGETLALEATMVREILDLLPETLVPGAPALVRHVVNFRGRIVPVADLRLAFAMEAAETTPDSRIVVIELPFDGEATLIGLRTDHVREVATLTADASEEAPVVGMRWHRDYVRRLVRWRDDLIILPDLTAIFAAVLSPRA
ncbi:chemotaxis protein CheW [Sphingomonas sp. 8AM]|uniref:chemotaxis protein CheW n=1 Tax=Sphingomonas sp. 8AM TaxID=2653170 RepID=UPI00135822CD|nr:chemotaxis protein CheW [Sphingomonas sp. 8AM]